jgi:transcriptional regulator with XRE-family HTH domain
MDNFYSRLQWALQRRLYPNAPLHLKQVAGAIGRSPNTVTRWWRGETHINGDDLFQIALFFARRGDAGFLHDVFGELVCAGPAHASSESGLIAAIRTALAETASGLTDHASWVNAAGEIEIAKFGHAEYVRRILRLPNEVGDLAAYAIRVLGWIAVTERSDSVIIVRHDGRRIAPLAAERLCEWLEDRSDRVAQVRRLILLGERWIEAQHPSAHVGAEALAKAAFIVRSSRRPWTLKRLPLTTVSDDGLINLIRAYQAAPAKIVTAAAASGALTTSSLFGVTGDDVTSHYVGSALGFDPRTVEGLNVLSRPDTDYGLMLQARILQTTREGPTYYELTGTIDEYDVRYLNLSLPEPCRAGRVLSSSVVIEKTRIAA